MQFDLHWASTRLVELKVSEPSTGLMNKQEAHDLAVKLIILAERLLSVDDKK